MFNDGYQEFHNYSLGNVLLLIIAHGSMPADRDRSMIDELRQKVVDLTEQLTQERAKVKQVSYFVSQPHLVETKSLPKTQYIW